MSGTTCVHNYQKSFRAVTLGDINEALTDYQELRRKRGR